MRFLFLSLEYAPSHQPGFRRLTSSERRRLRRRIIAGGKIGDEIRKQANAYHSGQELPAAEKQIDEHLRGMPLPTPVAQEKTEQLQKPVPKESGWKRFFQSLRSLLIP